MGSCYCGVVVKVSDAVQFKKKYLSYLDDLRSNHGNDGYNGTLSTCDFPKMLNRKFNSLSDAENYVSEHSEKRDAMAVQIADVPCFDKTAVAEKLYAVRSSLIEEQFAIRRSIYNEFKQSGKKTRKCPDCKVVSPTENIKSVFCPSCKKDTFLFDSVSAKRYALLSKKIEKITAQIAEKEKAYYEKKVAGKNVKYFWYVGGWAAE